MDDKIRKKILIFLTEQYYNVEKRKGISETERITKIIQLFDAMDEIESIGKPPEPKPEKNYEEPMRVS